MFWKKILLQPQEPFYQNKKGNAVPAFVFATNHPAHYIGKQEIDPAKNYFFTAINIPEFKKNDPEGGTRKIFSNFVFI